MHYMARRGYLVDQNMAHRLKMARALKYDTATRAADALGFKQQTYLPYESGLTGFARHAPLLADRLGIELEWLLTGKGPMKRRNLHPVAEKFERIAPEFRPEVLRMLDFYLSRKP